MGLFVELDELTTRAPAPQQADATVAHDGEQPRAAASAAKAAEVSECAKHGFLNDILCFMRVAQQMPREIVRSVHMGEDHALESRAIRGGEVRSGAGLIPGLAVRHDDRAFIKDARGRAVIPGWEPEFRPGITGSSRESMGLVAAFTLNPETPMNPVRSRRSAGRSRRIVTLLSLALAVDVAGAHARTMDGPSAPAAATVEVRLSEWKVELEPAEVPAGRVVFHVTNAGKVPHAFEVEGRGLEKQTSEIQPGKAASLAVDFPVAASGKAVSYEVYCPVGKGSHEMLGMKNRITVGGESGAKASEEEAEYRAGANESRMVRVTGGGSVVQILPGPYPFADSAMAVIDTRPDAQRADLLKKAKLGPYSNQVATIRGDISVLAIDRGASGDSVSGTARFTTGDGARWRVVMDRVQTKDIPFNPRFGGVIMGLYYHGATNVHTPLVPTIQSSLALWAFAHLYRNDRLVSDDAMVHVMLLSRTRRPGDWALDCWDCSDRPVEELQLQVMPGPGETALDAPGGVLFVNWEKSGQVPGDGSRGAMGARQESSAQVKTSGRSAW